MAASETNHWHDERCARAFWDQSKAIPYRELQADTGRWLDPRPGERWLDLGCGDGQGTELIWHKSHGQVAEIVAIDSASAHEEALARRCEQLTPTPQTQIRFIAGNLNDGLPQLRDAAFNGIVCSLA